MTRTAWILLVLLCLIVLAAALPLRSEPRPVPEPVWTPAEQIYLSELQLAIAELTRSVDSLERYCRVQAP